MGCGGSVPSGKDDKKGIDPPRKPEPIASADANATNGDSQQVLVDDDEAGTKEQKTTNESTTATPAAMPNTTTYTMPRSKKHSMMGRRQPTGVIRANCPDPNNSETETYEVKNKGLKRMGSEPMLSDLRALPEHFFLIFDLWPCVRPGVPEFLKMLHEKKKKGEVQRIYIYTANTSLHWVRFIMQCIMQYYSISLDTFDGIKHAPGGLKVVPEGAVLYDDHPENAIGNCISVVPYTNEIPWDILAPVLEKLPDHTEASCPLWEECGGLQSFIERDKQYTDPPHDKASERTLFELIEDFKPYDEILLDLDETLIAGARMSAYYNALNHFLMFREDDAANVRSSENAEIA